MSTLDDGVLAAKVLAAVRGYVARAVAPLQAKIDALIGEPKIDVDKIIAEAKAQIPPPKFLCVSGSLTADEVEQLRKKWDAACADADPVEWLPVPKDGQDGKSVSVEDIRSLIVEEISNTIALIPKPKNGEPGRDAAHLEIIPAIDEAKSYPRGTYAKHRNGFWRAFERTDGMRGWECLVAGIASIEVAATNERQFVVQSVLSDFSVKCDAFTLPVAIYRGVYVEGRKYEHGDQVSWGAHQWHCNEDTTDKPIEGGKAWTLAVKRGRDGKPGDPGPPGKDRIVREKA